MTYGWREGDPWVICDRTGYKVRMSQTVVEPETGLRVRRESVDPPHPADSFVYVPKDDSVSDARPGAPDKFVDW